MPPDQLPTYHFLYLAPGLNLDYFFVGARNYWLAFDVMVVHDIWIARFVPFNATIGVTALAQSDTVDLVKDLVGAVLGDRAYLDLLVYDYLEDVQFTLDVRAERNEPFGVPLLP